MCERDSMEGNVALKALNRDMNLGSTSFLPPPAYIRIRSHIYKRTLNMHGLWMTGVYSICVLGNVELP